MDPSLLVRPVGSGRKNTFSFASRSLCEASAASENACEISLKLSWIQLSTLARTERGIQSAWVYMYIYISSIYR